MFLIVKLGICDSGDLIIIHWIFIVYFETTSIVQFIIYKLEFVSLQIFETILLVMFWIKCCCLLCVFKSFMDNSWPLCFNVNRIKYNFKWLHFSRLKFIREGIFRNFIYFSVKFWVRFLSIFYRGRIEFFLSFQTFWFVIISKNDI